MTTQRVGIFGGTFDPPHVGHLVAAVNVSHALSLDSVLFVVANIPWQKAGSRRISAPRHRLAMVELAVVNDDRMAPSTIELERGGASYTVDTLRALAAPDRELFLVLGSDAAAGLPTWERAEELPELATVAVVDRPGSLGVTPVAGFRWERIDCPLMDVSSSNLRDRIATGRPVDYLVPRSVVTYIAEQGLYG